MAGNRFSVEPGNPNIQPALAGIGGLIKQNREEKQKKQEIDEIMKAVNSNDPDQVADLMIRYPGRAKEIQTGFDMKKGVTEPVVMNAYQKAIADPANAQAYLDEASDEVEKLGRNPVNLREDADMFMENPEGAMQNVNMTYAGLDPKGYKAFQEQQGGGARGKGAGIKSFAPITITNDAGDKKLVSPTVDPLTGDGTFAEFKMPEGYRISTETPEEKRAAETAAKAQREADKIKAKNDKILETETKRAEAKAQASAKVSLQKNKLGFDKNIALIEGLRDHKGKAGAFGVTGQFPSYPGSETSNFEARLSQLKNTVFISNREVLKGGGAITDFEGTKAEEAELRVSNAQSVEEFDKALDEYEYWVKAGFDNIKRAAKGDFSINEPPKDAANNAPQSAIDYLKTNPQAAEQFKAKYGYLP